MVAVGAVGVAGAALWSMKFFGLGFSARTESAGERRARRKAERRGERDVAREQVLVVLQDVLRAIDAGEEDPLRGHTGLSMADLEAMAASHRSDAMLWAHWEAIALSQLGAMSHQVAPGGGKRAGGRGRRGKRPARPDGASAAAPENPCAFGATAQPQGSAGASLKSLQRQLRQSNPAEGDASARPSHELFAFALPKAQGVASVALGCRRPFVAVACADGTVRLYNGMSERAFCSTARAEGGDRISCLDFSADDERLFCVLNSSQEIRSFRVEVADQPSLQAAVAGRWAGAALAAKGRGDVRLLRSRVSRAWLLTAAGEGQTTEVRIWSPEGSLLHTFDTKQVQNFNFSLSSPPPYVLGVQRICLAGIVSSTASPGVKVKVLRQRKEDFVELSDCMRLKSPKSTRAVCFAPDGSRAVVSLESGGLQLWDTAVRYQDGESPKLLVEAVVASNKTSGVLDISPDGRVLAAACGEDLEFLTAETLQPLASIPGAHAALIAELHFSADGSMLATCPGSGRPRFWRVPPLSC